MKKAWLPYYALVLAVAACLAPDGEKTCGGSIGCGNPPSVAELDPSEVNLCMGQECGSGSLAPTEVRIRAGKSLSLKFTYPMEADTPKVRLYIYASGPGSGFAGAALDSFEFVSRTSLDFTSSEFKRLLLLAKQDSAKAGFLDFTVFAKLNPQTYRPNFEQFGLLAGLGFDNRGEGRFITAITPSWGLDSVDYFGYPTWDISGKILGDSLDAGLASAESAFVFIPGSPYRTKVNLQDSLFQLADLSYGFFELHLIVAPGVDSLPAKLPVFRIKSAPGTGQGRIFQVKSVVDSITNPF